MLGDSLVAIWTAILDGHGPALAAVSFGLTVVFGGAAIYRYGGRLDELVAASMRRPLVSVVYGAAAYSIVVLLVGYAYSQLLRLAVGGTVLTALVVAVAAAVIFSLGGLGFVVVGAWVAEFVGVTDPWIGLVALGAVSALVWVVLPVSIGAVVWIGIASVGIGGPARLWLHEGSVEGSPSARS